MKQYLDLLQDILDNGTTRGDRTGTGTIAVFGRQLRFDLREGFPAVTTKKLHFKSIIHELLWFLSGDTNIKYLNDNGVKIWNEWADENGELGPVYGYNWRRWPAASWGQIVSTGSIDQITQVINSLKTNPNSRRHIVSAWNVGQIHAMALPPCHLMFQFFVDNNSCLSCMMTQRSVDSFLGLPFNIASYAMLTHMIAQVTGYEVGELILSLGDTHLYLNHLEQVKLQLSREPKLLSKLVVSSYVNDIDNFTFADIRVDSYESHPAIKGEISV